MIEYPVGTVADIVAKDGHTCRATRRQPARWACVCGCTVNDGDVAHLRPLLVLDPADLPSAERLRDAARLRVAREDWMPNMLRRTAENIADALDGLPEPTEPEPLTDDPGYGVVVVDRDGCLWTRLPGSGVWATASAANDRNWPSLLGNFGPLRLAEDGAE